MDIHQIQVKYDAMADRLLMQVRTRAGEVFAVWLTRRMVQRLWPPFRQLVTRIGVARTAPGASVLPEAREMMAQAVRDRPLPAADFNARFDAEATTQPLGPEPLLPAAIDMAPGPAGPGGAPVGLLLKLREHRGRSLELRLGDDLATALLRLVDKALVAAEWGLGASPAAGTVAQADVQIERPPGPLN